MKLELISYVRARRAGDAAALANGDISSLVTQITSLQSQFTTISNDYAQLESDLTALQNAHAQLQSDFNALQNSYNAHVHPYTDVDNLGNTLNKNTATHS